MLTPTKSVSLHLIAILSIVVLIYAPSLSGGFVFDDSQNIVDNESLTGAFDSFDSLRSAAMSSQAGPLGRPAAMLSFAANIALFGDGAMSFRIANLLIHLINCLLVFACVRRIVALLASATSSATASIGTLEIALWITLLWALHPINLTAVAYIVQRMASLSATFALLACYCFLLARIEMRTRQSMRPWIWAAPVLLICTVLAVLTKESGALIPLYLLAIEYFVFRGAWTHRLNKLILTFAGICGLVWLWCVFAPPDFLERMYASRPFNPTERLLSELRILFFYVYQILVPNLGSFSLFHDDVVLSASLLNPFSTFWSLAGWIVLVVISFAFRSTIPLIGFGVTWFLAGHVLESLSVPLDLVYEHRNYLPSIGIITTLILGFVTHFSNRISRSQIRVIFALSCAAFGTVTVVRAWQWGDPLTLALTTARHSPSSQTAVYELAREYHQLFLRSEKEAYWEKAIHNLEKSVFLGKEDFNSLSAMIVAYDKRKLSIDQKWIRLYRQSLASRVANNRMVASLIRIIECQIKKKCLLNPKLILQLSASLLDNPDLKAPLKHEFLEWLALYYVNLLGDFEAAERIMLQIISDAPLQPKYRLRMAEIYFVWGKYQASRTQIDASTLPFSGKTSREKLRFQKRKDKLLSDLAQLDTARQ